MSLRRGQRLAARQRARRHLRLVDQASHRQRRLRALAPLPQLHQTKCRQHLRTHQECARRARREQPRRERHAAPLQRAGTPRQASGSRLRSPALEHLHQRKGRRAWRCWTAFPRPRVRRVHFRHVTSRVPSTRPSRPRRLPASAMPPSGAHPSPSATPCNNKKKARITSARGGGTVDIHTNDRYGVARISAKLGLA
jgi:hypothetical protein